MTGFESQPKMPTAADMDPAEFSQERYRALLSRTVERLPPRGFEVLLDPGMAQQRFSIIRHDIDMSVETALELGRVEAALGVRATYMVLLSGNFYSPFEAEVRDQLIGLADLGHDIGLHFDASFHGITDHSQLDEAIIWGASVLQRLLKNVPVRVFSFHVNTPFTMSCRAQSYGGLLNAYAGVLQDEVRYVSDSSGYWRFKSWEETLEEEPPRLQVLTHPEWWVATPAFASEKVCRHAERRSRAAWTWHALLQRKGGRATPTEVPKALASLLDGPEEDQKILYSWLSGHRRGAYCELLTSTLRMTGPDAEALADIRQAMTFSGDELAAAFESLAEKRRQLR